MILEIKKMGINGEGIAYDHKLPVFIEGALPTEIVDVEIVEDGRKYKKGKITKLIKASSDRLKPACPYYQRCSACNLAHCSYDAQLLYKKNNVEEALNKYADYDLDIDIIANPYPFYYRNELKQPLGLLKGEIVAGFYSDASNHFVAVSHCLIHDKRLELIKEEVLKVLNRYHLSIYDKKTKKGLRSLFIRVLGNKAQVCIISGNDKLDKKLVDELFNIKDVVSLYQSIKTGDGHDFFGRQMIHLSGSRHLNFKYDDLALSLSMKSFYQLNSYQLKRLYREVCDLLPDNEQLIVEAYCGIGMMSLLAADKAKEIVGIEYVEDAIINARRNAVKNSINNVSFLCGDSGEVLRKNFKSRHINTLIVDPPRSGLDDEMIDCLLNMNIDNIIYVSCNPSTLAKNLANLKMRYRLEYIKALDMFSNTIHVETCCLLVR